MIQREVTRWLLARRTSLHPRESLHFASWRLRWQRAAGAASRAGRERASGRAAQRASLALRQHRRHLFAATNPRASLRHEARLRLWAASGEPDSADSADPADSATSTD